MELMILHLSDMHFGKKNNYELKNINAITKALQQSIKGINHIQFRLPYMAVQMMNIQ